MITYKLKIDCNEPRHLISDMEFVAGDVGAYRLEFSFYNGESRMDISNKLCTIKTKRADGVVISDSGEIKENKACFTLKNSMYAIPGELMMEIALSDSAQNYITTVILSAKAMEGLGTPDAAAESEVSVYVTLLAQTTAKLNQAEQLLTTTRAFVEETETKISENAETAKNAVDDVAALSETVSQNLAATEEAKQLAVSYSESAGAHHAETERLAEDVLENKESVSTLHAETERLAGEVLENKISADESREAAEHAAAEAKEAIEYKADQNDASNALKGTASGETVRVDDVSPLEHQLNVNVRSKNILDVRSAPIVHNNAVKAAYTWARTETGFTIQYINESNNNYFRHGYIIGTAEELKGKTVSVSFGEALLNTNGVPHVGLFLTTKAGVLLDSFDETMGYLSSGYVGDKQFFDSTTSANIIIREEKPYLTATIPSDADFETYPYVAVWFGIGEGSDNPVGSIVEYKDIQVELGETATEYEPYVDPKTVTVTRYGTNILDVKNAPIVHTNSNTPLYTWERTETGFKAQFINDTGSSTGTNGFIIGTTEALKGKTITVSYGEALLNEGAKPMIYIGLTKKPGTLSDKFDGITKPVGDGYVGASDANLRITLANGNSATATIPKDSDAETYPYVNIRFYLGYEGQNPADSVVEYKDIQVEFRDTATEYEPYKESITYTSNADGVVENVVSIYPTMTFATNKLGAIIDCEYNKDANKVIEKLTNAIISLGGNV